MNEILHLAKVNQLKMQLMLVKKNVLLTKNVTIKKTIYQKKHNLIKN
jgi:hypothetical protein